MNDEVRWLEHTRLTAARTAYSLGIRAGAEVRLTQPQVLTAAIAAAAITPAVSG